MSHLFRSLIFFVFALGAFAAPLAARAETEAAAHSYFVMSETFSSDVSPFPKWTNMQSRFTEAKKIPDENCGQLRFHPCVIGDWKKMIAQLKGEKPDDQLIRINDFANAFPYITDQMNWEMEDFWETPFEFMAVSGDCEDYAIAKYYTLRALGTPPEKLRIIIVQDFNLGGVIHAILGVYTAGGLMILDNQSKQVLPAMKIYHYKPIYGINEQGWWAYHS